MYHVNTREDRVGGPLLPKVQPDFDAPRSLSRFILFVHGYNTGKEDALSSYQKLESRLRQVRPGVQRQIFGILWPGDWKAPVVSAASYSSKRDMAPEIAARLANWLQTLSGRHGSAPSLVLVAHSMGCRIALELARVFSASPKRPRLTLILMAAAVGVHELRPGRIFRKSIRKPVQSYALYSWGDSVLARGFPIGEGSLTDEAVGSGGLPIDVWTEAPFDTTPIGHGDYWSDEYVAKVVAHLVGLGGSRPMRSRGDAVPRSIPARALSSIRTWVNRSLTRLRRSL